MDHTDEDSVAEIVSLSPGRVYLFEERIPYWSYKLFKSAISGGRPGLVITRDYPDEIQKKYSLPECAFHWLTHLVGDNNINPTALGLLLSRISSFINKNSQAVVLIDGVEYLISQNSFDRILHLIHQARDMIITEEGTMILPLDMRVVEDRELALLERNLEVFDISSKEGERKLLFELEDGLIKLLKITER